MNRKVVWALGLATAALAALSVGLYLTNKPGLHGAVIDPPMPAAEIRLTDFNGRPFALTGQRGKLVVLYFGYTNCPDQCPLTMAHLKLAMDMLGAKTTDVEVVMISTDPARDNAAAMKEFLGKFSSAFIGLTGSPTQLQQVWSDYGVTVENGGETHSNFIYVIDSAGGFRETFLPDSAPADVAADLRLLLRQ